MTATGTEDYVTEYSYNDSNGNYTALLQKEVKTVEKENELDITNNVKQTFYAYDKNGNQIKKTADGKTETNTYDGLNQLIGFTDGETTASYKYNASGLRYEKTVNGETVNHVWDGSQQIVADVIDNQFYEADCYIRGTNLAAKYNYQNGNKSEYTYYTQNAHGDVVNLTDETGKVTKTYKYDAFGVEKNIDENDTNAFRYCGEYYDAETGTIYLRARYYNPSNGRFISRDSYAGSNSDPLSLNLYTYCHNNPILGVDPSGHVPKWLKGIGNAISDAAGAVKDWACDFGSDALECGKDFVNAQYDRGQKLWNDPGLYNFANWFTYGMLDANQQRYEEANDAYGYANWLLSGIPDMVKGTFEPDKPLSFQHVMDSFGVASLATSIYTSCIRGKFSVSKNNSSSFCYSPVNPGPLDMEIASTFRSFTYTEKVLSEDTIFYRVYGGNAEKVGHYMTRNPQYGGIQSQFDLALKPEWNNTTEYLTRVLVPQGTVIYEGAAAPQVINGGAGLLIGGGNQVYIPEVKSEWFLD